MLDPVESEKLSVLLSTYLDREFTGTKEEMDIVKLGKAMEKHLDNIRQEQDMVSTFNTGSRAEGIVMKGSDWDCMSVDLHVIVACPGQYIPPDMANKTILYMTGANCRPGYVHLQLRRRGSWCSKQLYRSFVTNGDTKFVSSDIYREENARKTSRYFGYMPESNGPSCREKHHIGEGDMVHCFPCKTWPSEANEWITRPRLYGWPSQTLIKNIVESGCHLVPVGDKCSEDHSLQWRISFATAELALVNSFSHTQLKVYVLLKYFLKQIKNALKENIGDDDILCSYFLKTTLFHAVENSSHVLWQEKNLFHCFWFCFNILITWVRAGFCPNYFIPRNNMFQRKIHGLQQQVLLDILNTYCQMKWKCLSVGDFYKPSIWEHLCDISIQAQLVRPETTEDHASRRDLVTNRCVSQAIRESVTGTPKTTMAFRKLFQLFSTSNSEFDDICIYSCTMQQLQLFASEQLVQLDPNIGVGNKAKYRRLRKYERWIIPNASIGTEVLYLATFYFCTGNLSKTLQSCKQVLQHNLIKNVLHAYCKQNKTFRDKFYRQTFDRFKKNYEEWIILRENVLHPPHISLELTSMMHLPLAIHPIHYALFLSFLCYCELGDIEGRNSALQHLLEIQKDPEYEGHVFWIHKTLLGLCYEILGDSDKAIMAYWESALTPADFQDRNPAIKRIAVVYLCMYASKMYKRG